MPRAFRFGIALVLFLAAALVVRAKASIGADADLQFQLGNLLFEETRYWEALQAFDRAIQTDDAALAIRARKGKIRTALRVAEFAEARKEAEALDELVPHDAEALSLLGDALWSCGLFDEADAQYREALSLTPDSSRARFGVARSLSTRSRLPDALSEAWAAVAAAPRDGEIHALVGEIYERMNRYEEAAIAYTNYINLLPNKDRSEKAAWSRAQVQFLEPFGSSTPVDIEGDGATRLHTIPFRLVKDKIVVQARVNGSKPMDFILDTGSESTMISAGTAQRERVRPVTYTLSAGVGEVGLRGLQLARLDSFEIGTLKVLNLPVLIKNPALRGIPRREGESFSPLSLGMSMAIDYQNRLLTVARTLPAGTPDFKLPMRIHRLAMVRGLLNSTRPAYFVVDTGGEVISISSEMANTLEAQPGGRRIPLKVWGTSGWDREAFLMPGMDLEFDKIRYSNFPLVVLNLRAPSVLLGFQLGGIVGHKFLGSYRVAMDLQNSELRLEKF
jgi:Flp pilus assembly protein TadD/predicted aspartyl protease